jgi:hypothetical protein
MRILVAAALASGLAGCAAEDSAAPASFEATSGGHRLRYVGAAWGEAERPAGWREIALRFDLGPAGHGTLVSREGRGPPFEAITDAGTRVSISHVHPELLDGESTILGTRVDLPGSATALAEAVLEFDVLRVERWREHERGGLMDASLDEAVWPPFHLRFAGEGEAAWLSAGLVERVEAHPAEIAGLAEHLGVEFVNRHAVLRDAKGRRLVRYAVDYDHEDRAETGTYAIGKPGGPVEADPAIRYPVTLRLRIPEAWTVERVRFRFRDLPLPPAPPVR